MDFEVWGVFPLGITNRVGAFPTLDEAMTVAQQLVASTGGAHYVRTLFNGHPVLLCPFVIAYIDGTVGEVAFWRSPAEAEPEIDPPRD